MNTTHLLRGLTWRLTPLRTVLIVLVLVCMLVVAVGELTPQPAPSGGLPVTASVPSIQPKTETKPAEPVPLADWNRLTPTQKVTLQPLTQSWGHMSHWQKKKWLTLSANFSRMSPKDQAKLQERMTQWAALKPKQRQHARLNFAEAKKLTPQQKNEKWQAYQALSPEAKQKLAKAAQPKPPRTALATRPTSSTKIKRVLPETPLHSASAP